jgi:hypothetical protein
MVHPVDLDREQVGGGLTVRQVSTAAFMPVLFVGAPLWWHPSRLAVRS